MGCLVSLCATQIACCCCSSACSLCCSCCPSSVASVMTRLMYLLVMILGVLTSGIFLIPAVYEKLSKSWLPFYDKSICDIIHAGTNCEKVIGYQMVYRIWFAYVMFFLLLAIIMIRVRSSSDPRAGIHNGFWFFKILILIAAIVGAYYIPGLPFNDVWMYFGFIGGLLFVFIQVIYLIDFAHNWTEAWLSSDNRTCSYFGFFICTAVMYGLAIAGFVGMFLYYTSSDACTLNKVIISVLIILCFIVSVISILPGVQEANPNSGLMQASVVTMYSTYLTFSGLSAAPAEVGGHCPYNANTINGGYAMIIVGIVIAVLTVFYLSLKSFDNAVATMDEEKGGQNVADDEDTEVKYNYSFFHILCLLASLYIMMVMTNWFQPKTVNKGLKFAASWPSMWVQIVASWLCLGLYVWTLIAPLVCPTRTFSWSSSQDV